MAARLKDRMVPSLFPAWPKQLGAKNALYLRYKNNDFNAKRYVCDKITLFLLLKQFYENMRLIFAQNVRTNLEQLQRRYEKK